MTRLIVVSGASGVGKGTVLKKVMERRHDLSFSVSATTRPPRPGEVDGVHYYFITKEKFEDMIRRGEFLEYDAHMANYYGTPRTQAEEKLRHGSVLLDIEPPSMEELEKRIRGRGDTPEDQIALRLERAKWEMEQRVWYDHVLVNDDADRCAEEMLKLIENF